MNKEVSHLTPHLALNHLFRWQFASSLYMSLLQLVVIILLGRFLGYKELGIYTIFQLIFRLAISVFEPGMFVSVIQKSGLNKAILNKEKRIQLILVFAGIAIMLLLFALEKNYLVNNTAIVLISLLLFGLIGSCSQYPALLTRQLRQKEMSVAQMLGASLEFIFILSSVWFISPLLVFCGGLLIRFIVFYGLSMYYVRRIRWEEDLNASVSEHIRFSSYQTINQGLSFVQGNFDSVLVGSVFGLTVLGPYNYASEVSYLVFSKINPVFNKAVFPVLAKYQDKPEERQNIISESLSSHALICISIYLILCFHVDSFIPFIVKDPEQLIASFAKFILIMAMIRSVNNMVFNQLLSLGESRNLLKWNVTVLIINYAFVFIIYLTHTSIQTFLLINIFLSFAILIYVLNRLRTYYHQTILFDKQIGKYLIFLSCCSVCLYCTHWIQMHFLISVLVDAIVIFIISFLFYKEKVRDLIKFKIM